MHTYSTISFGPFEADLQTQELRKHGVRLRLPGQSFQILKMLLERPGELVSREELHGALWPSDTFVDFEKGINAAVKRLREALGDSPDSPRFVETLPRRGYRFIGMIDIHRSGNVADCLPVATPPPQVASETPVQPRLRIPWGAPLAVIFVLVATAMWLLLHRYAKPVDAPPLIAVPFTSYPGVASAPSFSPDGNQIAFAWDGESGDKGSDLYVRMIGANTVRRLTNNPAGWLFSAWSPDGTSIAFTRQRSEGAEVVLIAASGGQERRLAYINAQWGHAIITWSPDGKYLALTDRNSADGPYSLYLLSLDTLQRRPMTTPPAASVGDWCPAFSPDGQSLAFIRALNWGSSEIRVLSLGSGEIHTAATDPSWLPGGLTWTPDGTDIIFASKRKGLIRLWRVPAVGGEPHVLGIGEGGFAPAISYRSHRLAYMVDNFDSNIWRTDLIGSTPRHTKVIASTRHDEYPEFSPEEKRVAFASNRSGSLEIWVSNADGSNQMQVTHFEGPDTGTVRWSPDGRQLVFDSHARGHNDVYIARIDGGSPRLLMPGAFDSSQPYWSHDGRWIYFASDHTGITEIWKVHAEGGEPQQVSHHGGMVPYESPDGEFLYFLQPDSGQFWKVATAGGEPAPVPGIPPFKYWFSWKPSREGIYFVDSETKPQPTLKFFRFATRTTDSLANITNSAGAFGLSVSADGRTFLYGQLDTRTADIMLVEHFH